MDILGYDIPLPDFGNIGSSILWSVVLIIIIGCIGLGFFFLWDKMKYRYKIILFENLGGTQYVLTGRDKAKLIKMGDGGEEILYLKKRRCYRTAYGKKMGKNTYWFAVGQDGYWYNITLGDLDAKMGQLDIEPVDKDMRMMHVAIRKNIADRYRKQKFMEKYGTILMSGIFLIIMGLMLWFLISKIGDASASSASAVQAAANVMDAAQSVMSSLDNICSGSGVTAA